MLWPGCFEAGILRATCCAAITDQCSAVRSNRMQLFNNGSYSTYGGSMKQLVVYTTATESRQKRSCAGCLYALSTELMPVSGTSAWNGIPVLESCNSTLSWQS